MSKEKGSREWNADYLLTKPSTKHIVNLKLKHISDVNFREKLKHVDDVNFREKRKHVYDVCQFQRIVFVRLSAFLYTK
jgi:hypothetical protein